jgi:hypothetical protein
MPKVCPAVVAAVPSMSAASDGDAPNEYPGRPVGEVVAYGGGTWGGLYAIVCTVLYCILFKDTT